MASTPSSEPSSWTPPEANCEKCGAPESWAEDWTKNLSFSDGAKFQMATYFASPRMWPLGYILASPYSPLHLEQKFPNCNWRDRFEDLLALESGNKMISAVSRQNEAITASRVLNESVHDDISYVNSELQRIQDYVVLVQKLREVSVRRNDHETVSLIDENAIPYQKRASDRIIATGKALIENLKDLHGKPASRYKKRVPWITSLISSGAMPEWEAAIYDSSDGAMAEVEKANGSGDGKVFTEMDLTIIFKDGIQLDFRPPAWSTYNGSYDHVRYPQIEALCPDGEADPDAEHTYNTIDNVRPSIFSQLTKVLLRKSPWNGSMETRVTLMNRFTDGTEEEKTIVNDTSKVLEEVEKAQASMKKRNHAVGLAISQLSYRKQKEVLDSATQYLDEGVD